MVAHICEYIKSHGNALFKLVNDMAMNYISRKCYKKKSNKKTLN